MIHALNSIVFLSVIVASYASPVSHTFVARDKHTTMPKGFTMGGAAPADQVLNMRIALTNTDITSLQSELIAVSTPSNSRYRQFLSKEQVRTYFIFAILANTHYV